MFLKLFRKYSKGLLLAAAILVSVLIFIYRGKFAALEGYGYFGLFTLSILGNATIILPVPVVLTAFLGGGVFNPFWVGVVVSLGATIGELTGYLMGHSGGGLVEKDKAIGNQIKKIKKWMNKWGLWVIFALAAVPNPAFDLAGIVAGASKISVYKYLAVVFAGKLLKFLAISYLGASSFAMLAH